MNLPAEFEQRMQKLLGAEYPEFLKCYEKEKKQGLRVNTKKISVEEFLKLTPFELKPIPWTKNGFFYREEDKVTKHPHYFAGLYYIQEPSAMVPASRLPIEEGDRVLDLCAAPGGKATELGAKLQGSGMLVANDVSVSRARGLLKNLELFGIPNLLVTGETPEQLKKAFGCFFDKILVDAPCSGEGMFRKDPSLIKSWIEKGPEYYAPLQKEILSCAAEMLRPGGKLLYSTCTFSPEEDEQVILEILQNYPELHAVSAEGYEGFSSGILEGAPDFLNEKCIRIWPHCMDGEGHFTVLLEKECGCTEGETGQKTVTVGEELSKYPEMSAFFEKIQPSEQMEGICFLKKEEVFWIPKGMQMPKLRYLRTGLHLGTLKKGRFEPSQALALVLRKKDFANVLDLPSDHSGVIRYLKGETLDLPELENCTSGWVLVCCDGYPLGWGKCVNGMLRNKYQTGWRMQ